ncbi:hypothetical protein [Brevibacillus dissolubilis]|uniref:glycoside hydrolase family 78 protein n=1 Tax=Brevibacillus dissolubilis TaxID=1844116 RepID=UPI001116A6FE|nr:hypothetical protein [Brevibacillus dissolubilis]
MAISVKLVGTYTREEITSRFAITDLSGHDVMITSLYEPSALYLLEQESGKLYRTYLDGSGSQSREYVSTISPTDMIRTGPMGGVVFGESLYLMEESGNLAEFKIADGTLSVRSQNHAPTLLDDGSCSYPSVTFHPVQEMGAVVADITFTIADGQHIQFRLYQVMIETTQDDTENLQAATLNTSAANTVTTMAVAPNKPVIFRPNGTSTSPTNVDWIPIYMSWSFSDPDAGDRQQAYQVEIYDAATNSLVTTTGKVISQNQYYSNPATELQPHKTYKWRLKVWDTYGYESPYTDMYYFSINRGARVCYLSGKEYGQGSCFMGLTPRLLFKVVDPDGDSIAKVQIKVRRVADNVTVVDQTFSAPIPSYYDVPAGVLEAGKVYSWQVIATDSYNGTSTPSAVEFTTGSRPEIPTPIGPVPNSRVSPRPTFEFSVNHEPEGHYQHFQVEVAENNGFEGTVRKFNSRSTQAGWEAYDGSTWTAFPAKGVRRRKQLAENPHLEERDGGGWASFWSTREYNQTSYSMGEDLGQYFINIKNTTGELTGLWQIIKGWQPGDVIRITASIRVNSLMTGKRIMLGLQGDTPDHFSSVEAIIHGGRGEGWETSIVAPSAVEPPVVSDPIIIRPEDPIIIVPDDPILVTPFFMDYFIDIVIPEHYTSDLRVVLFDEGAAQNEVTDYDIASITAEILHVPIYEKVRYTMQSDLPTQTTQYWRVGSLDLASQLPKGYSHAQPFHTLFIADPNDFNLPYIAYGFELYGSETGYTITSSKAHPDSTFTIEYTSSISNTQNSLQKELELDFDKYYLILAEVKSTHTDVCIEYSGVKGGPLQRANCWETLWLKINGRRTYGNAIFHLSQTYANQKTQYSQIRMIEIPRAEYERIDVDPNWTGYYLRRKYPYAEYNSNRQNPQPLRIGDQLICTLNPPIKTSAAAKRLVMNAVTNYPKVTRRMEEISPASSKVTYTGTWSYLEEAVRWTNQDGATAEVEFTGTSIVVASVKDNKQRMFQVFIDNEYIAQVDLYHSSQQWSTNVFEYRNLVYGKHKLRLKAVADKHPSSQGTNYMYLMPFVVFTDEKPATLKVEACNNFFDPTPAWEDITSVVQNGGYYTFVNQAKKATAWGLNIRITLSGNGSHSPIELDGFGFSFE